MPAMSTVTVTASARLVGLAPGQTGEVERTAEVEALIANGRLQVVGTSDATADEAPAPRKRGKRGDEAPAADDAGSTDADSTEADATDAGG